MEAALILPLRILMRKTQKTYSQSYKVVSMSFTYYIYAESDNYSRKIL